MYQFPVEWYWDGFKLINSEKCKDGVYFKFINHDDQLYIKLKEDVFILKLDLEGYEAEIINRFPNELLTKIKIMILFNIKLDTSDFGIYYLKFIFGLLSERQNSLAGSITYHGVLNLYIGFVKLAII